MMNKTENIKIRTTPFEKEELERSAAQKGFFSKAGNVQLSSYVRWILEHGEKPVDRSSYSEIKTSMQNVVRLGTLLNQLVFQTNKERKILNSQGFSDENNKHLLERIDRLEKIILELKDDTASIRKSFIDLTIFESA